MHLPGSEISVWVKHDDVKDRVGSFLGDGMTHPQFFRLSSSAEAVPSAVDSTPREARGASGIRDLWGAAWLISVPSHTAAAALP